MYNKKKYLILIKIKCIAFLISTFHLSTSQQKPFNPILGETYQAFINGCPLNCEQISHHPAISYFNVKKFLLINNYYKKKKS